MEKKVIVRGNGSGVFYGTLVERTGSEVKMKDCRRLWFWEGAASVSQLAVDGTKEPDACLFTVAVPEMEILDIVEVIPCTEKAINSIESVEVWKA